MAGQAGSRTVGAVAMWGSTDRPGFGDQLLARVCAHELAMRLPGWRIALFAPAGWTRPIPADGGFVAEPLGERTAERVEQLAAGTDLTVICPGFPLGLAAAELGRSYPDVDADGLAGFLADGLGAEAERRHPLVWAGVRVAGTEAARLAATARRLGHLAVRDEASRRRLAAAGLEPVAPVVPHPGVLAAGLIPADVLAARAEHLRLLGTVPDADGPVVLVQATAALYQQREPFAAAVGKLVKKLAAAAVVVLRTEPTADEQAVATALVSGIGGRVEELPADAVLEDRLAVLAAASFVVSADEHVTAAAAALGRRWLQVDLGADQGGLADQLGAADLVVQEVTKVAEAGDLDRRLDEERVRAAQRAVAALFDAVAGVAERALANRGGDVQRRNLELVAENNALRAAQQRLRDRMFVERQRLADRLAEAWLERDELAAELAELRAEQRRQHERLAVLATDSAELAALQRTKLMRWSDPMRRIYGKVRSR